MAHVHDDLAGALHDVAVVEALVALRPPRARLGDSVMFCPFAAVPSSGRVGAGLTIAGAARLARLTGGSVARSVPDDGG